MDGFAAVFGGLAGAAVAGSELGGAVGVAGSAGDAGEDDEGALELGDGAGAGGVAVLLDVSLAGGFAEASGLVVGCAGFMAAVSERSDGRLPLRQRR